MKLDSEYQRTALLEVINHFPMQGDYGGIKPAVKTIDELFDSVTNALLDEPPESKVATNVKRK